MRPIYKSTQKRNNSSRSRILSVRIEATQKFLVDRDYKDKASPLVRALLRLAFNKKIPDLDKLIQFEIDNAEAAQLDNLALLRDKLTVQRVEKERERDRA